MSADTVDLTGVVWLRREALADGYSDRKIQALVTSGEWHRVRRGAYCSGELWGRLSRQDRHRVLCRAVLRTAHPSTVLSHVSAAVEHGVPVWGVSLEEVHTTRTDGKCGRREAGVVHHRGHLPQESVVEVHGVRVTSPGRCAVEVCAVTGVESALVTVNGLLNARATTLPEITAISHDTRFWPDSLNTRIVLGLAEPKVESALESRFCFLVWAEHLPRPELQVEVRDELGDVVGRLDFAWPEAGVFVEADGRAKYQQHRRPGESLEQFLMREKAREEAICLITGWTCLRINWADLADRPALARRIRRVLERRAASA